MNKLCVIIFALIAVFCTSRASAQSIKVDFPFHKNKNGIVLTLKQGTKADTVFVGNLDADGKAVINLKRNAEGFAGMVTLHIKGMHPEGVLDFIVSGGENLSIHCRDQYPYGGNVSFEHSPENRSLQSWFFSQSQRLQKTELILQLKEMYSDNNVFPFLEKEAVCLKEQQKLFVDTLAGSELYAARFIELRNLLSERIAPLILADSTQMLSMRTYVRDSLDINSLYTSGMWFDALNGLLAIYSNDSPFHREFINDMAALLKRCDNNIYTAFAENLFSICESTGWNDLEEQLAYFLINDGRIENPTGKLKMLMTLFKLSKGSKVPALTQAEELPAGKTLLVFYESGCGPCENEMMMLKANYPLIKEKGYRIISVAADSDTQVFRNTADAYPWQDKYCDGKGFAGDDFRNYGVTGTPTFYVINQNGILEGRYARLQDTKLIN